MTRASERYAPTHVQVDNMTLSDVPEVMAIERASFAAPWPASAYRRELTENRMAHYIVLRLEPHMPRSSAPAAPDAAERRGLLSTLLPKGLLGHTGPAAPDQVTLAGFAGLWLMVDEAHVTTIGVRPQLRGRGYGELLLVSLIEVALDIDARWLTLEVRVTNEPAQALYRKYGFQGAGVRKKYYSDNNEDALIMWTDELSGEAFRGRYSSLKESLLHRLDADGTVLDSEPIR